MGTTPLNFNVSSLRSAAFGYSCILNTKLLGVSFDSIMNGSMEYTLALWSVEPKLDEKLAPRPIEIFSNCENSGES